MDLLYPPGGGDGMAVVGSVGLTTLYVIPPSHKFPLFVNPSLIKTVAGPVLKNIWYISVASLVTKLLKSNVFKT